MHLMEAMVEELDCHIFTDVVSLMKYMRQVPPDNPGAVTTTLLFRGRQATRMP